MLNLGSLEFHEEDFNDLARVVQDNPGDGRVARIYAMALANRLLRDRLGKAPQMTFDYHIGMDPENNGWRWEGYWPESDWLTHLYHGRLVCIQEIGK